MYTYMRAKKTIKFSRNGKDWIIGTQQGIIYTLLPFYTFTYALSYASIRKSRREISEPTSANAGRVTNDNNLTRVWVHMAGLRVYSRWW